MIDCKDGKNYVDELRDGQSCKFDHVALFADTQCTSANAYGFRTDKPCILLKLNKIISWLPASNTSSVLIKCTGESSADKDNLKQVTYHSGDGKSNNEQGEISGKYFPFFGQKDYRAPFVFAQFDIAANTLVNVECRAYADNIDNQDRLNRRGMTKFSLFVSNKK